MLTFPRFSIPFSYTGLALILYWYGVVWHRFGSDCLLPRIGHIRIYDPAGVILLEKIRSRCGRRTSRSRTSREYHTILHTIVAWYCIIDTYGDIFTPKNQNFFTKILLFLHEFFFHTNIFSQQYFWFFRPNF